MTAINASEASRPTVNWNAIDWQTIHEMVRRLQARIVKATQQSWLIRCETASCKGRLKGLSRMKGNFHVWFLGGLGTAISLGYPVWTVCV